jgi:uncharacterized membrane protein YhaH (DUF805 family)
MNVLSLFATFTGRISRSSYWCGFAMIVLVGGLGRYILKRLLGADTPSPDDLPVMLWSFLVLTLPLTALIVKRFHDRGRPSWIGYAAGANNALYVAATYFGYFGDFAEASLIEHIVFLATFLLWLFAIVENGFLPGTHGPNRYGPEPSAFVGLLKLR